MKAVLQVGMAMLLVWGAAWVTMLTLPERAAMPPAPDASSAPASPAPARPEGEGFRPRSRHLPEGTRLERDILYAVVNHRELKLDLYLPPLDSQAQLQSSDDVRYPLVIYIHGSATRPSSKERVPLLSLLSQGFAVASVDYRPVEQAPFPAALHDCKAAVRFLRAHAADFQLDPARFGVYGSSLGGQLAALLGTTGDVPELEGDVGEPSTVSSAVQAVAIHAAPTDLVALLTQARLDDPADATTPLLHLIDPQSPDRLALARQASPVTYVSPQDPPFLVLHYTEDTRLPLSQGRALADALVAAGGRAKLLLLPAGTTGPRSFLNAAGRQAVQDFFRAQFLADAPTTAPSAMMPGP